jgi:signal transduction histidine kinase
MMPEMDGFELCAELKKDETIRHIPVIFISALTDTKNILKGFEVGGVDYITKPFQKEEVFARVTTHLNLKRTREELLESNQAKDKLLSIISHDLRGPFSSLINFLDMVRKEPEIMDRQGKNVMLNKIYLLVKNTYDILDNLLTWAQSQQNKIEYHRQMLNVFPLLESSVALVTESAREKSIHIELVKKDKLIAFFDYQTILVVIRNLVSNAVKFTPEGGTIIIRTESNDDFVEIFFEDTGLGMDRETMNKLFRPDIQFTTYGTHNERGSGLGLLLCKEFVEKNQGEIRVRSEEGKGSVFSFTLPKNDTRASEKRIF